MFKEEVLELDPYAHLLSLPEEIRSDEELLAIYIVRRDHYFSWEDVLQNFGEDTLLRYLSFSVRRNLDKNGSNIEGFYPRADLQSSSTEFQSKGYLDLSKKIDDEFQKFPYYSGYHGYSGYSGVQRDLVYQENYNKSGLSHSQSMRMVSGSYDDLRRMKKSLELVGIGQLTLTTSEVAESVSKMPRSFEEETQDKPKTFLINPIRLREAYEQRTRSDEQPTNTTCVGSSCCTTEGIEEEESKSSS